MTSKRAQVTQWLARLWLPLSLLFGVLGGLFYSLAKEPVYTSDAYVVVVSEGDMAQAVHFAQAYTRIAVQPFIIGNEQAGGTLSATASPDAPIIRLTAQAATALDAAARADQAASALILYANGHAADTRVRLTSFATASVATSPSSPVLLVNISVGGAAAALVTGLLYLGAPYVRPRSRREPDAAPDEKAPAMSGAEA
ncbi:hypothetical protein [Nonomuraea sp. NPDC003754]